ncbi:hypothetical protein [Acididesulfobacillus acetoxydans]|uniref:hypothetical protein n=1 Tax=Acididesulfobacillus acetoxydans TaxID=1561005 RepID=UPI001F116DF5|nr:hypothetical protein [Acididesulfobacillus acetoxydans]
MNISRNKRRIGRKAGRKSEKKKGRIKGSFRTRRNQKRTEWNLRVQWSRKKTGRERLTGGKRSRLDNSAKNPGITVASRIRRQILT